MRNFKFEKPMHKAYEPPLKERAEDAVVRLAVIFLGAVVIYAIAMLVKNYNSTQRYSNSNESMLTVIYTTRNHRIFYDTETKVMYIEYTGNGGISPMYNPDGSLRVYKE